MDSRSPAQSLTLLEAGFKILPGKEEGFFALQQKMVPVAAKQPGFLAVYGGLIHASKWLYFGVRFETQADMETWHLQPQHQAMQKQAYAKWWSAVYLRKWRQPVGDEQYETRRSISESGGNRLGMSSTKPASWSKRAFGEPRCWNRPT